MVALFALAAAASFCSAVNSFLTRRLGFARAFVLAFDLAFGFVPDRGFAAFFTGLALVLAAAVLRVRVRVVVVRPVCAFGFDAGLEA